VEERRRLEAAFERGLNACRSSQPRARIDDADNVRTIDSTGVAAYTGAKHNVVRESEQSREQAALRKTRVANATEFAPTEISPLPAGDKRR